MPAAKKRKLSSAPRRDATSLGRVPTGIEAFGKISKAQAAPGKSSEATWSGKELVKASETNVAPGKKRKAEVVVDVPVYTDQHDASNDLPDERDASNDLPDALQDLVNLCSSFLTALSLHFAHHGTLAPVDLRPLAPTVERAWGKRKVLTMDIQRILGVLQLKMDTSESNKTAGMADRLHLCNYGGSKICVETRDGTGSGATLGRPLDEDGLNTIFTRNVTQLWIVHLGKAEKADLIKDLPLAPIKICPSLDKMAPLFAKGQRRLEEFKAMAAARKQENIPPLKSGTAAKQRPAAADRQKSLLERIRAKQLHQTKLSAPPTPAKLARKSAVERLDEIIPVLDHLSAASKPHRSSAATGSASHQRVSIPLPLLHQQLQNSLANPITKEQSEQCMRILAEEMAPGWIELVRMGLVVAVVVKRGKKPAAADLRAKMDGCT